MRFISPLRYPGGKARLAPYISKLISSQKPRPRVYAEAFAGGAGAALKLLTDEDVDEIVINDLDPGIAAFWRSVFHSADELIESINHAEINIRAWREAKNIYDNPEKFSDLDLGFATFFLNRCNRSGILTARPIGGMDQTGKWKIDARFNRLALAERVRFLSNYSSRVTVEEKDARAFISSIERHGKNVFLYVDPPYIAQGDDLYLDALTMSDHEEISTQLKGSSLRWLVTYDTDERITGGLYGEHRIAEFMIAHTAHRQHVGTEFMVFSKSLTVSELDILKRSSASWVA